MEHVQIQTSQNVALEYETASVGDRILAVLADLVLLAGYLFGTYYLGDKLGIRPGISLRIYLRSIFKRADLWQARFKNKSYQN